MKRARLIAASALTLGALSGTAVADSVLTIKSGAARVVNDDPGVAGEFTVELRGDRVYFTEPKDPQGVQYPIESCQASEFNSGGLATQVHCPKSAISSFVIEAGPGEDVITYKLTDVGLSVAGGTGADKVTASDAADDLSGEQGNDTLTSGGGDDFLAGDEGSDTLDAGVGNDKIEGGPGTDTIAAGAGDDTVRAADGLAEKVDCGEGNDTATADTNDELVGCESVTRQSITGVTDDSNANDKTAPKLDIGGSLDQRFGKAIAFVATCSEKGVVNAVGFVDAAGINSSMKPNEKKVETGGGGVRLKLAFNRSQLRNIRADLRKRRTPRVRVTISCVDNAGNTSKARKFWIKLRK